MKSLALILLLTAPTHLVGQVVAKTADSVPGTPRAATEVVSPMQLDIPLGAGLARSISPFPVFWNAKGTADFISDKAQVVELAAEKATAGKKNYKVTVRARALTDWYRQDIDFTLSLLAGEKVLATKKWKSYTLGPVHGAPFSGDPLNAKITLKTGREEFDALFEGETPPSVRIVLDVLDYGANEESTPGIQEDDPNDLCPITIEIDRGDLSRYEKDLEGVACSQFPYVTYERIKASFSQMDTSLILKIKATNNFSGDLKAIVEVDYLSDGSVISQAVLNANLDEGDTQSVTIRPKIRKIPFDAIRLRIYTGPD